MEGLSKNREINFSSQIFAFVDDLIIDRRNNAPLQHHQLTPFDVDDLQSAPIIKKYQEPSGRIVNYLIIVKSIISGACVLKTNLNHMIWKIEPEQIFIVAPVMYYQAEQKLKNEFNKPIYDKFQFFYFAKDDQRTPEGEVLPGIGGMIYNRLVPDAAWSG